MLGDGGLRISFVLVIGLERVIGKGRRGEGTQSPAFLAAHNERSGVGGAMLLSP